MRVEAIQDINGFFKVLNQSFQQPHVTSYEIVCYDVSDYEKIKEFLVPVEEA